MVTDSTPQPPEGLTNKEKRKWRQEQKRLAAANQTETSSEINGKRKRQEDEDEDETKHSEPTSSADPSPAQLAEHQVHGDQSAAMEKEQGEKEGSGEGEGEAQAEAEAEAEAEALSHKEKRKRRKMEKAQAKFFGSSSQDPETGKRPTSSYPVSTSTSNPPPGVSGANKPSRSPFSLWIANLSFQTSPQRLQEFLEEKGIKGISRVHMPKGERRGQYSKGFCYVDVPSQEALDFGISLSESHLDGRRLLIKSGSDFRGRPTLDPLSSSLALSTTSGTTPVNPNHQKAGEEDAEMSNPRGGKTGLTKTAQKILRSQKHPPGPTLFVGNLSFESTEEGLREMIERSTKLREERDEVWGRTHKEKLRKEKREARRANNLEEKKKRKEEKKKTEAEQGSGEKKRKDEDEDSSSESEEEDSDDSSSSSSSSSSDSDSGSESSGEEKGTNGETRGEATEDKKKSKKVAPLRGAGIRKIRMGTFEDSGKCKGFAFVDFHSSAHATATLLDTRNTFLDGRTLVLQYAGADAIKRGAVKGSGSKATAMRYSKLKNGDSGSMSNSADGFRNEGGMEEDESGKTFVPEGPAPVPGTFDPNAPLPKKHKETQEERRARREREKNEKGGKGGLQKRAKPGAALANAKRESQGIVLSEGKKVTFD